MTERPNKASWRKMLRADLTCTLTDDLLQLIFRYLSSPDLVSAGQVCQRWRHLAKDVAMWKHRIVVRRNKRNDKKVLRVLRFAPCLDTFDSEFCRLGSRYKLITFIGRAVKISKSLEDKMMDSNCQIRALRVHSPSAAFMRKFGPSIEELTLATSDRDVLEVVEHLSLKVLSLRWLFYKGEDEEFVKLNDYSMLYVIESHKNCLECFYGDRKTRRSQMVRDHGSRALMQALSSCTNLRKLCIHVNPDMKLLHNLQHLKKLVVDISSVTINEQAIQQFRSDFAVPSCVQILSLKVLFHSLHADLVPVITSQCAKLPSLETITIKPYSSPIYQEHLPGSACEGAASIRNALPGVIVNCYCCVCST